MTDNRDLDQLDALFGEARADAAQDLAPSDDLMARLLSDAANEMPRRMGEVSGAADGQGLVARILAGLGGWAAVSGLAAATVAGVWIGVAPPDAIDAVLSGGEVSVSILPDLGGFDLDVEG